jgi:hypothetical protein
VLRGGRVADSIDALTGRGGTRRETVTSPEFLELRERALAAIE